MDAIGWLVEVIIAITKHGFSSTAIIIAVIALFKAKGVQNRVLKRLPKRFRTEDRLERMERKVDALMSAGGVVWDAEKLNLSASGKSLPTLLPVVSWYADIVEWFTQKTETFRMRGRMRNMSSKLKSRKFWLAIISAILVVLNEGLDLGISSETVITFSGIVLSFIFSEAYLDGKKLKAGGAYDYTGLDAERKSAEDTKAA
jgi:hypothetical protein